MLLVIMLHTILNIHDATKLHAKMLHAILLHGKFNVHDATLLHATFAYNKIASCMVDLRECLRVGWVNINS